MRRIAVALAVAGSLGTIGAGAQDTASLPLTVAQRFMEAAFPDLKPNDARVFATVASSFNVDWVRSGLVIVSVNPKSSDAEPFLAANIDILSGTGTIHQADFRGRRVNTSRSESLQAEAQNHPNWTDDALAEALHKAGGRFSYKDQTAFEESLHLERFEEMFGSLKQMKSTFAWRVPQQAIMPTWHVEAHFLDRVGQTICYTLLYEPFDGALRSARRVEGRDCPQ